ncbi:MAG: response regulator transcription factor [Proteobacteria bacterium]|nr:response regulator transcription factor [Pseudomonadota bacterium]
MRQIFVSSTGQLNSRWATAFSEAEILSSVSGLTVTGSPAVVWLDTSNMIAAEAKRAIAQSVALGEPVVVMAATPGEAEAFQVLNAGCVGYCHVNAAAEQLREIALVVEHGGLWMLPELMQRLLALSLRVVPTEHNSNTPELNELTARELMVADQVAHGATNREIAESLEITERTVKAHLSSIFGKLEVRDRVQLALAMNSIPTHATVN